MPSEFGDLVFGEVVFEVEGEEEVVNVSHPYKIGGPADTARALGGLGYVPVQSWSKGRSRRLGATYLVLEQSPDLSGGEHDRCRPGVNHLAFHVEDADAVEALVSEATRHGWNLLFPDRHPHAGGEQIYAAYMENADGFEIELVAIDAPEHR